MRFTVCLGVFLFSLSLHGENGTCLDRDQMFADLVVARDGSGNYTSISQALNASPNRSMSRYTIYIKKGVYGESVTVEKNKWNISFIGDGIGMTILSSNRSNATGHAIRVSGALVVLADGFLAVNITFENTSGPSKGQAVAMRSIGDRSTFYCCSFLGYQDTLFADQNRQFYRECEIYGTVDFVFGDAAVVLQNCKLFARKPGPGQTNMITAQGRGLEYEKTGTVLHNCTISPSNDLTPFRAIVKTYLGRPWKKYSTVVVMQSYIGDLVDAEGWREWDKKGKFLDTLVYKEFQNRGPGSNTTGRVHWSGYSIISSPEEAKQYTVDSFINGGVWLPATQVPFNLGLI